MPEVIVHVHDVGATSTALLANAWIYWRTGQTTLTLRADQNGRLFRDLEQCTVDEPLADPTMPWMYVRPFFARQGDPVEVYFSRGAKPIPAARIAADRFTRVTLGDAWPAPFTTPPPPPQPPATVCTASPNALAVSVPLQVLLTNHKAELTVPVEMSLWPMLRELIPDGTNIDGSPTPAYYTDGMNQGAAMWTGASLNVTHGGAAPPVAANLRPKERGLRLEGRIEDRATGARIQLVKPDGSIIQLRQNAGSTAGIDEIAATMAAAAGGFRPFSTNIYLANSGAALGPVYILVHSDGAAPPFTELFYVLMAGAQIALVDDRTANLDGQTAGTVPSEVLVTDFLQSPQASSGAEEAQCRARRMVTYSIGVRQRRFSATLNRDVEKPEMPFFMAEFHLAAINENRLRDLMVFRRHLLAVQPATFGMDLNWRMRLSWDGPDIGTGSPRLYSYQQEFTGGQHVEFQLGSGNLIAGVSQGVVANALQPAPTQITYPIANRRLPRVLLGSDRAWGAQAGAPALPSLVVEWQPSFLQGADEIMRGGDGLLSLPQLQVDGQRVHPGLNDSSTGPVAPPASDPDLRWPRFRVKGDNPTLPATDVIDAAVEDYYNQHLAQARVSALSLATWQETIRRILAHEANKQFEDRGTMRRRFAGQWYGHEQDMPIFGAPHGYGYGQHDNPAVNSNGAWSFFENIKESVRRVMEDKATGAYNAINAHMPAPVTARWRAVYRREVVRRYNGGTEFHWNGADWEIQPTVARWANNANHAEGPNQRLLYPNQVLGTGVVYFTGAGGAQNVGNGAATNFPWPIAFTAAQFGPMP